MNEDITTDNDELDEELFEHHKFVATKGQSILRIDKYLMHLLENATRNKIQQAAASGNIFVNDVPVKSKRLNSFWLEPRRLLLLTLATILGCYDCLHR